MDGYDPDTFDLRPRTWSDAFPWIPSKAVSQVWENGEWWNLAIDETDVASRAEIVGSIAALAIDRLPKWSIGEVFPGLPADLVLGRLDLPVRATNVLSREHLLTAADLIDHRVGALLGLRNAGVGTVTAILRALAEASALPVQAGILVTTEPSELTSLGRSPSPWLSDLIRDLTALADWNHAIGDPGRSVLAELSPGASAAVVEARKGVLSLTATDVLPTSTPNAAQHLDAVISGLDERLQLILSDRLFAWDGKTLQEIGVELGVVRERARQLEVKARAKLSELVMGDNAAGRVSELIRAEIHGIRPLAEVVEAIPALGLEVKSVGQPLWRVMDVLDDAYEIADGWCAKPSFEVARRDTEVFLDDLADTHGVVPLADVVLPQHDGGTPPWLTNWLVYLGYEVRDRYVLLKAASLNDTAAAILSIEGEPLTWDELHRRVGRGAAGSLRNQVGTDPLFTKVDREHVALTEWGLQSYTNIRVEIGNLLDQAGGELPLADIVRTLAGRFGVSPNSVSAYAGGPPYQVINGVVRRHTGRLAGAGKNPAKVRGYYRRGGDWLYRTTVTFDHLRGSGWPASTALSTILRMAPGERTELPTRLGPQKFSYKEHQPSYGSIRRFLEDLDLGIGDEIFLVFRADGTFNVEQLPSEPASDMAKALRLVGADTSLDGEAATRALGSAIKFSADADLVLIAEGYKARREQLIHDLVLGTEPS